MVSAEHITQLRAMWESAGKPRKWAVPLFVHQEYERALMHTTGRYTDLSLSNVLEHGTVVWMTPNNDLDLPEGF